MSELDQPKWYILHTYSGYEAMVKDSLEKLIENNNLGDYIVDLKIPMEQVIEEKNGKRKVVERKLLPCYVFIRMSRTCCQRHHIPDCQNSTENQHRR